MTAPVGCTRCGSGEQELHLPGCPTTYPDHWRFIVALVNRDDQRNLTGLVQLYYDPRTRTYRLAVDGAVAVSFDRAELVELRDDLSAEIDRAGGVS